MTKIYLVKFYLKGNYEPYYLAAFTNKKKAKEYSELNNIKYKGLEHSEIEELKILTFSSEEELQKLKGAK